MRRRAVPFLFLLPLTIGYFVRCGPSGPGSPTGAPGPPDPGDAPLLSGVSPGDPLVHVDSGGRVEFHIEATSPRSLPLSITFLVDGLPRATGATFVFQPVAPGTYRVTAEVTDGDLSTIREWTVDVDPPPPVNLPPTAVLGIEPGSGIAPLSVRFRVEGGDPDGAVIRWRLELVGPDPVIIVRTAPIDTVIVLGAGDWQATAVVEDGGGATAVATRSIPVSPPNQPPLAILRVDPATGTAPLDVLVEGDGSDPDGSVARYRLDLDGDGAFDVDGPTPFRGLVRFDRAETRWVRLVVTDDRGAEARDSVWIRVSDPSPSPPRSNAPPTASLMVIPASGIAPLEVVARASGSDSDGSVVSVRIDFDEDGDAEAEGPGPDLDARHLYDAPGTRTIRVTVADNDGATASATATVSVLPSTNLPPTGSLKLDVTSGDAPLEVTVTASGSDPDGRIVQWEIEADEGTGFFELDETRSATLVYEFSEGTFRPRLRLTDDAGGTAMVDGPAVTVYRPIAGGSGTVSGNARFDATAIAPAVWSNGTDPWRFSVTVRTPEGDPLAGVPLRAIPDRRPLVAPDGTELGPGAIPGPNALVTGGGGGATGTLVTSLSTRIEAVPGIGFQPFDLVIEADAGHGQWRVVTRLGGLNANSTVAASGSRVILHPGNAAVCPGTSIEIEVQARDRSDAPRPGAPTAGAYAELRYTDGSILAASPLPGYRDWRTDGEGTIRFSYVPIRADQSRLVRAWVDGQQIDELVVLALRPVSQCGG